MAGLVARRAARARIITRRLALLARWDDSWMVGRRGNGQDVVSWDVREQPGRLAKYNLTCSCRMCRYQGENPGRQDWHWDHLLPQDPDESAPPLAPVFHRLPGRYRRLS